jgi:hypothetical protein
VQEFTARKNEFICYHNTLSLSTNQALNRPFRPKLYIRKLIELTCEAEFNALTPARAAARSEKEEKTQ